MAQQNIKRYIWLVDTIRRHGRITRQELDECWMRSSFSDGHPLPRRTFYSYRQAVAELFDIEIAYDATTFSYYIANAEGRRGEITDWMLNSVSMSDVLSNSGDVAARIFVEDVPSARDWLATVIDALRASKIIEFDYQAYYRSRPTTDIRMEPYFLKLFRQRWYVTGRVESDNRIKTYALDRVTGMRILARTFRMPEDFDAEEYVRNSFGVIFSQGRVYTVKLKATPREAKYLRTLPLHPSQEEMIHDEYSIFHYRMRLTPDLVGEILSHGPRLEVLEPAELRAQVAEELRNSLSLYAR